MLTSMRFSPNYLHFKTLTSPLTSKNKLTLNRCMSTILHSSITPSQQIQPSVSVSNLPSPLISGIEDALMGFIFGKRKTTEVAHSLWQKCVHKGDVVVDATCGNGLDTLALLKMVADGAGKGCVYGFDIQDCALKSTSSLVDAFAGSKERELVKLFCLCHSRMEDVIPKGISVRLVTFNLGYLPGGDKSVITTSETTLMALQAASRILGSEGLISTMVYVGHPGGREELETVLSFASSLPVQTWVCTKFNLLNRANSPVLVLLFKK